MQGKRYPLEAEINLTEEENGAVFIDLKIEPTANNRKFIKSVAEDWLIFSVKDTEYGHFVTSNLDKESEVAYSHLKVETISAFIHTLQTTTFDWLYTGSRTAVDFIRMISKQSGIQFTVRTFREVFGCDFNNSINSKV